MATIKKLNPRNCITVNGVDIKLDVKLTEQEKAMLTRLHDWVDVEMGNSFAGVEAFVKAFEDGVDPPSWTIEWIAHAFKNYLDYYYGKAVQSNRKSRKKTVDEFLGLGSKGRLTAAEKRFIRKKNLEIIQMWEDGLKLTV